MKRNYLKITKLFKPFFCVFAIILTLHVNSQNLTSSPYSRYLLGQIHSQNFAVVSAMGGAGIAFVQDSAAPNFINFENPAALSSLKLTTFEAGGIYQNTNITSLKSSATKVNTNFAYAAIGFPISTIGGAAFGILPYSSVGYEISSNSLTIAGNTKYNYNGEGGLNKLFAGIGLKLFKNQVSKYYKKAKLISQMPDKPTLGPKLGYDLLSQLSLGASANYLFGNISQNNTVAFIDNSKMYNARKETSTQISGINFNFGLQTGFTIDSVWVTVRSDKNLVTRQKAALTEKIDSVWVTVRNDKNLVTRQKAALIEKTDSVWVNLRSDKNLITRQKIALIEKIDTVWVNARNDENVVTRQKAALIEKIDSVWVNVRSDKNLVTRQKAALTEKINISFGFFSNLNSTLGSLKSEVYSNYVTDGYGNIINRDTTAVSILNKESTITLPFEIGAGLSIKYGDRLTSLFDITSANWSSYKFNNESVAEATNSIKYSFGLFYKPSKLTPEKTGYFNRAQYRFGAFYNSGYLTLQNTKLSHMNISLGIGLPLGRSKTEDASMLNLTAQYGVYGTTSNNLIQENYFKVIVGVTFSSRWFVKYKHD